MKKEIEVKPLTTVTVENYQTETLLMTVSEFLNFKNIPRTPDAPAILNLKNIPYELATTLERTVIKAMVDQDFYIKLHQTLSLV